MQQSLVVTMDEQIPVLHTNVRSRFKINSNESGGHPNAEVIRRASEARHEVQGFRPLRAVVS